jgi:23S rRNA (cytidine1920-2'-O)/16S rRNA (cytidine1409-2'-O)-methyltransferase
VEKQRLDLLLVERGLCASREQARACVLAGRVTVDGRRLDKPGTRVPVTARIVLLGTPHPYVGRGGLKLERALAVFGLDLTGKVVLDVGAATGGFTDCALQHGAAKVYAVDVGYGQLAWKLRRDPRVVVLERANIRYLEPGRLEEPADVATVDVSFISLLKVLPAVKRLLRPGGRVIALVKPQFEAGREKVGKRGVVRSPATHLEVLERVVQGARELGFGVEGLSYSPVKGPEGNIEFWLYLSLEHQAERQPGPGEIERVVAEAHRVLGGTKEHGHAHLGTGSQSHPE